MLRNGRWVPTFPRAKYVFHKREYAAWEEATKEGEQPPGDVWRFNCEPIVAAGQALLVDDDYTLDDTVWLTPTPGHSPCHCCVNIKSGGQRAVVTGDLMHHALQVPGTELVDDLRLGREGGGGITTPLPWRYRRNRNVGAADPLSLPDGWTGGGVRRCVRLQVCEVGCRYLSLWPEAQNPSKPVTVNVPHLRVQQSRRLLAVQNIQHLFRRDLRDIVPRLPGDTRPYEG